ncbi:MAG: MaoC family dehydratase [Ilumatobacteraceae bacterium]
MSAIPTAWTVTAQNLPDHVDNPIHTDAGAQAQGFPSALVAGVTTYAYLTHPLVEAWGIDWLTRGGGEVRFKAPVFANAIVECTPSPTPDGTMVEAICPAEERNPRVTFAAIRDAGPPPAIREGDALPSRQFTLGVDFSAHYGRRAGDDLAIYDEEQIMHPVIWPAIGNRIMSTDLVTGAWIHTRSIIRHHAPAPIGATVDVHATVVERFQRGGTRAIIDVLVELDGTPLASIEHEAILYLSTA